jgi:plasmid maintenance system antidote protein VapI
MPQQLEHPKRAKNLRTKLFHAGIKVREAAKRLEVTPEHLSYVLNGHRESKSLLDRIDKMLEGHEDDLIESLST